MNLVSRRFEYSQHYTVSKLTIDNIFECYVLEDVVRAKGVKVMGETAIPSGRYQVVIDHSEHFGKDLPHLLNIPMFEGIRIHSGNTDKDTEGCLLVGTAWGGGDKITNSRVAFDRLFEKLQASTTPIYIEIVDTNK